MGTVVLLVILLIMLILYFRGKNNQKKAEEQKAQMKAVEQTIPMLIIDKKRMKIKDSGLPQVVIDQTPKRMLNSKLPIVKVKIGPKVMTLIADEDVFDKIPTKREVKAVVSGIYIIDILNIQRQNGNLEEQEDDVQNHDRELKRFRKESSMIGEEFFSNVWSKKSIKVKNAKESDVLGCTEPVKGNFYISNYACPYCGDPMFKTIFPIGREYNIKVRSLGNVKMKRVFTCFRCFAFYTATRDKLSDGVVYEYKAEGFWEHDDYVCDMEIHGTTQARPD